MVMVTPQAARHLAGVRSERGLSRQAGVRFRPQRRGVGITFSRSPEPGDTVIAATGIEIYIAPELSAKLQGSTIDVAEKGGRTDIVLRPPRIEPDRPR